MTKRIIEMVSYKQASNILISLDLKETCLIIPLGSTRIEMKTNSHGDYSHRGWDQ